MSKRTNLNALLFMLVFLPAMVGTTFAEPLFPFQVGQQYEYKRWDSADPVNEWTVLYKITSQETINSLDYFQLQVWNYDNDGEYEDVGYLRSTETALYGYNPDGDDYLEFQTAPEETKWIFEQEEHEFNYKVIEIVAIEQVTVPYGTFTPAYKHRKYQCANPDGSGDRSPYWYEWIVPGEGIVKQFDYYMKVGEQGPMTMELIDVTSVAEAGLDIERIVMCSQKDHLDGTPYSNPWRFEVRIDLVDPGTLHHIDVTPPAGGTLFTIYEDYGHWDYDSWPTTYPTLTALRAIYPTGLYTFNFRDSSGSLIKSVQLEYSGISEPSSPVDFTYPWDNGQTDVSTNPTFTWTVNSGAGDALGMLVQDDDDDIYIFFNFPAMMDVLSWQPGPLDPEQNHWLYVTVVRVKDWAGGPGLPTMIDDTDDEFEYLLHIGYMNKIGFTTGPTVVAGLDIERIFMKSCKHYVDGTAYSNPWEFKVKVYLVDPGTLHHIDVTPPAGGTPFTIYEDYDYWKYEPPSWYSTLTALQADYPPGNYKFEFCDSSNTVLRTVNLDNSGIGEPGSPVDFTYPSYNGQTGISTNPIFTWTIDSGAGHALGLFLEDDDDEIYKNVPVPMDTLSLQPGPLEPQRNYWLRVSVFMVKDPQSGPDEPTMTVDGDMFKYGLVMEYFNQIEFTTNSGDFCGAGSVEPDGYVDYWDLLYFAQRWHTDLSDTNWDPRCDLDKEDNYVDYWDLLVFAKNWHIGEPP